MHLARIAELLQPFLGKPDDHQLTTNDLQHISTYIDILLRWNTRINLTAIRDEEQIVTRHFGESLFAARHLFPATADVGTAALGCPAERSSAPAEARSEQGERAPQDPCGQDDRGRAALQGPRQEAQMNGALAPAVADLGSGAGFPGIPIKLWAPQISLTLIESNHKKATFLREVARALTLTDINIQTARAETLSAEKKFDVVTLRAVERFESIVPTAASLVAPAGRLALLIGSAQLSQARSMLPAITWSDPIPIPNSRSRILLIGIAG